MDQINNYQIELKCSKHPKSLVSFLCIRIKSQNYSLLCNNCITNNNNNDCILIEISETIQNLERIIPKWPLCYSEDNHSFIQEILNQNKSEYIQNQISQQIKEIKVKFMFEIEIFEQQLKKDCNLSYLEEFYNKYSIISERSVLINYLKQETCKSGSFIALSENFKNFLNQHIEKFKTKNNEFDKLVQTLKEVSDKQDSAIEKLQQLYKLTENAFKQQKEIPVQKLTQQNEIKELNLQNEQSILQINQIEEEMKRIDNRLQSILKSGELSCKKYYSCHQHVLTYKRMRDESQDKTLCNICNKNKKQSWNCNDCKFHLCLDCQSSFPSFNQNQNESFQKKRIGSIKHFTCHDHPLEFTEKLNKIDSIQFPKCSICQQQIQFSWNCLSCSYDLCFDCSIDYALNSKLRELVYLLIKNIQFQEFKCSKHNDLSFKISDEPVKCCLCKNENYFIWKCKVCEYSICLKCSMNIDFQELKEIKILLSTLKQKSFSSHRHLLKLTDESQRIYYKLESTVCDSCSKNKIKYSWHCPQCKFDLCMSCSKKEIQK